MLESLTQPNYPKAALGLKKKQLRHSLCRRKAEDNSALNKPQPSNFPNICLTPSFTEQNISNPDEMLVMLEEVLTNAGFVKAKTLVGFSAEQFGADGDLNARYRTSSKEELRKLLIGNLKTHLVFLPGEIADLAPQDHF